MLDAIGPSLKGCRVKLRRANAHLDVLGFEIDQFIKRDPYEVVFETDPDSGEEFMWFKLRENPPDEWSAVIGDILHNLRSCLDHLAFQLVYLGPTKAEPTRDTYFPIFKGDPFAKKADPQSLASWKRKVTGMAKADVDIIKSVQPYTRGKEFREHPLFILNEAVNWDKHKELHLSAHHFKTFGIEIGFEPRTSTSFSFSPFAPLDQRAAAFPVTKRDMNVEQYTTLDVAFRDGEFWELKPVWPTLATIANYVTDIVNAFEARFPVGAR